MLAVVFKSSSQWRALAKVASPGFEHGFKAAERSMKAIFIGMGDIFMAGITVPFGRVGYHARMSYFLFPSTAISTVTDNAAHLAMRALDELGIFQEDLLPYLQRR